eukprot:Sdes_comp15226_c0_seq1m4055
MSGEFSLAALPSSSLKLQRKELSGRESHNEGASSSNSVNIHSFQDFSTRKIGTEKKVRPFFTIEVLNRKETLILICVIWFVFIISVLFIPLELFFGSSNFETLNLPCETRNSFLNRTPNMEPFNCFQVMNDNVTLSISSFSWDISKGVFEFSYSFQRVGPNLPEISFPILLNVTLFAKTNPGNFFLFFTTSPPQLLNQTISFQKGSLLSTPNSVLSVKNTESSNQGNQVASTLVQNFIVGLSFRENITNFVQDGILLNRRNFNEPLFYFSIALGSFSYFITFFCLLWFLCRSFDSFPNIQNWPLQLKFAMLYGFSSVLSAQPFHIFNLFFPENSYVSSFLFLFSSCSLLLSLLSSLLLLSSLAYPSNSYSSLPWKFYSGKLSIFSIQFLLILVLFSFSLLGWIEIFDIFPFSFNVETSDSNGSLTFYFAIFIYIIVAIIFFGLYIWLIQIFFRLRKSLKKLPYLAFRFRHLSMRAITFVLSLLVLQFILSILFLIFLSSVVEEVSSKFYDSAPSSSPWITSLLSIIVMYIFLPVKSSGHLVANYDHHSCSSEDDEDEINQFSKEDTIFSPDGARIHAAHPSEQVGNDKNPHGFSISTCRWMMTFASETYRIDSFSNSRNFSEIDSLQEDCSHENPLKNLRPATFGYKIIQIIRDEKYD